MVINKRYKINYQKFALLFISGILFGFSFPPFKTGIFSIFAFVPLFLVLLDSNGRNFLNAYFTFFIFNLISIYWVGGFIHAKDPYLMVAGASLLIIHPILMSIPIAVFNLIHKNLSFKAALYSFPFVWVSFEYLHSITELAFPWITLGNSLTYDLSLIQVAEYFGVYGLSFWIVCMNVLIFILIIKLILKESKVFSREIISILISLLILYLIPKVYGNYILNQKKLDIDGKRLNVALIQPDIDPWEKWNSIENIEQLKMHQEMSAAFSKTADLIVWSETAIPFYILLPQYQSYLHQIKTQIDTSNFSLLSGFPSIQYYSSNEVIPKTAKKSEISGEYYESYNSSLLIVPNSNLIQKYSKIRLVPFSERVPYAEVLDFLNFPQWDVGISGWGIGKDTTIFKLPLRNGDTVKFSNLICYESIYPSFVSRFAKKGAEFLTVITNDSWWGNTSGVYQHKQFAVLRAIENRRWVVRCANGGISCFINPYGEIYKETKIFTKAAIEQEIYTNTKLTFYTEKGDILPEFSLLISTLTIAALISKKFYLYIRRRSNEDD